MDAITKRRNFAIDWWVRPALSVVRACRRIVPEWAGEWLDKQIDGIVDCGIRQRQAPAKPDLLPATVAWLANIRAEAGAPRALVVIVKGPKGSVAIFPEDIVGKSDDELLAFIAARLDE